METILRNALAHHQAGRLAEAVQEYRRALALQPNLPQAQYNLGRIFLGQGDIEQAHAAFLRAAQLAPGDAESRVMLAYIFLNQNRLTEAEAVCREAVAAQPGHAQAHQGLSMALGMQNRFAEAAEVCRRAISLAPDNPELHKNLAKCLMQTGQVEEAEACCRQALRLAPDHADALRHLGMALTELGRLDEAFAHLNRHAALMQHVAAPEPEKPHKQRHDREQQAWLGDRATAFHIEGGGRIAGPAVNRQPGAAAINAAWLTAKPQIAVIDDLLTPEALAGLRHFCLASTIWRDAYDDGYLGAFPHQGFAPPLMAQIAEELRAVYPAILEDHPLLHFWAFKYDSALRGIRKHADFAAVNVNFWITPDAANLDPDHGGLVVWDEAAPQDWNFEKYNASEKDIETFLKAHNAKARIVPYRCNRAVIFDSDLFHETDVIRFAPGYENRRINITLLFGRR